MAEQEQWVQPEEGQPWTHTDAIRALCQLTEEVMRVCGYTHASDCFCGFGGMNGHGVVKTEYYKNDGATVRFIQKAVREELARLQETLETYNEGIKNAERDLERAEAEKRLFLGERYK